MEQEFYHIPIVGKDNPIQGATTLSLNIPDGLSSVFKFRAGQHLCFRFYINGAEERRMYSLHNSPNEAALYQVTVKTLKGGLISQHIADNLRIGDTVEVSIPQGDFSIEPDAKAPKSYYMFVAGSGITPIYAMIKSILLVAPNSTVFLLYGNRSRSDILFYEELLRWKNQFPEQLIITHTLSKRFLDFSLEPWDGARGRIDEGMLESFLTENPLRTPTAEYYICGPGGMNQMVNDKLIEMGVSPNVISFEYFSSLSIESRKGLTVVENASVSAIIRNTNYQVRLQADETILAGLKRSAAPVPYFCQSGICGTCKAKLLEGEVKMKSMYGIECRDKENGMILTCQALAQTAKLKIEFL